MGVRVIALAEHTHVSRVGLSMISSFCLSRLAATSDKQRAIRVDCNGPCTDLPQLDGLGANLRERMQSSPNMNGARFSRLLDHAYHRILADH